MSENDKQLENKIHSNILIFLVAIGFPGINSLYGLDEFFYPAV
jgi:hypothetical protein